MFPYLSKVADGADLSPDQFAKALDHSAARELKAHFITRIVNKGGVIAVTASQTQELPLARQGKMRLATSFSFKFAAAPDSIKLTKLKGVEATRPGAPGWVNLDGIELTVDRATRLVTVRSQVSKLFFSLTLTDVFALKEIEELGWLMPVAAAAKTKTSKK